ncbi:type III pantothenate kinase [Fulvivirga sp. M361]|uniref:type III pantothenate kinase n=1 Tax=Fulvivirga sp. M361 TaxID=2594266 RepID=UPI00117A3CB7|nr:type III pantothenate kinase [Fulvivirga sp. M361]TRX58724.1 type III pantothenate kinase [Fulvivirga sp. M361]
MLLAVDIGNSNVTFGLYDGKWKETWRTNSKYHAQEQLNNLLNNHLHGLPVTDIVISSVVPVFTKAVEKQLAYKFEASPYVVGPDSYSKLPLKVLEPSRIGSDLVADAMAAHQLFQKDCIVVDFGTALTFTIISKSEILGVNIAPGLKVAMTALASNTARLSEIPLELPESVIGKDTTTAIQSGILWGYVGLVEGMIQRIEKELGAELKVVATGGLSEVLNPLHDRFDMVEPNLTLEGMRQIYNFNQK